MILRLLAGLLLVAHAAPTVVQVRADTQPWDPALARALSAFGELPLRRAAPSTTSVSAATVLPDGALLTTAHGVNGARRVQVEGQTANVVRLDPTLDLALLRGPDLSGAVVWGPPPPSGSPVRAVGFPADLGVAVTTAGVLSGVVERALTGPVRPYLLTDAAITTGSSGGPLLDAEGRVIGIVVGGLRAEGFPLGLALPADAVQAWLTASAPAPTEAVAVREAPDLTHADLALHDGPAGVVVLSAGPRAARFGWREGLVLKRLAGREIGRTADLRDAGEVNIAETADGQHLVWPAAAPTPG